MKFINRLLEIFFPKRPSAILVSEAKTLLPLYSKQDIQECISLSSFKEPLIRASIHEAKFKENYEAFVLLGEILSEYLKNVSTQTLIIPIPLSKKRYRERGYNQVTKILQEATKNSHHSYHTNILCRTRHTTPQTQLDKKDRLKNLNDAFKVSENKKYLIKDRDLLIIDDVFTTGSTMQAAKAALLPHHPNSISCLAIAH